MRDIAGGYRFDHPRIQLPRNLGRLERPSFVVDSYRSGPSNASVSSSLTNGLAFTVTGSGFGTKSGNAPIVYDDVSGASGSGIGTSNSVIIGQPWTSGRAHFAIVNTDGWTEQYRRPTDSTPSTDTWGNTAGNIITPATPFRSKYICGALNSTSQGGYARASLMFGMNLPSMSSATPFYIVASWYETISTSWAFGAGYGGSTDENFKWMNYTSNQDGPYTTNQYWYLEYQNGTGGVTGLQSATSLPSCDINDDSAGGQTGKQTSIGGDYIGPAPPSKYYNGCNGWVKREFVLYVNSTSTGWVEMHTSQPAGLPGGNAGGTTPAGSRFLYYRWDSTIGTGITDYLGTGVTGRALYIGGFRRNFPNNANRQYWSDIYLDAQTSGVSRFALTDTNSLSTATIIEYQPYTSWSTTSARLLCQKGNLASGTVYLWLLDEVNGHQSLGAYTMN